MVTPRRLLLHDIIFRYCQFVSQAVIGVYVHDIINIGLDRLATNISNDIFSDPAWEHIEQSSENLIFKRNSFNLCIITTYRKYKVFIGTNAVISNVNFLYAADIFKDNLAIKTTNVFYNNFSYRVECSDFIPGITISQFLEDDQEGESLEKFRDADVLLTTVANYIGKNFYIDSDGFVLYPSDLQSTNLILTNLDTDPEIILIDFDHIIKQPYERMYTDVANRFFTHISKYNFDSKRFPVNSIQPFWKHHLLTHTIDEIKTDFIKRIDNAVRNK